MKRTFDFLFIFAILTLSVFGLQVEIANAQFYRPGYQPRYYQPRTYRPSYQPPVTQPPVDQRFFNPNAQPPRRAPYDPAKVDASIRKIEADFSKPSTKDQKPFPRLTGEFEKQTAILLSVSDLMYQHNGVLTQIVEKMSGQQTPLVILFNDEKQLKSTVKLLDSLTCDLSHVSLYELKLDTIWLRDFGPRIAETENGTMSLDFFYDGQRPKDDRFPTTWGSLTNADSKRVEWTLQGGNLLSNGKGLALTTTRLFEDNYIRFPNPTRNMNVEFERRKIVVEGFKSDCNINQLMILEPLSPEATKHVDMFATFLAADHVLVAKLDPRADAANARVLDENARRLSTIKVDGKPMRVDRISIPPRSSKYWSPYTNIIFGNKLILMPVYDSDPPAIVRNAVNVYRKLLPGFKIDTVNMTSMQKLEGALHCMSINVPGFAPLPTGVMSFSTAREKVKSGYSPRKQIAVRDNPASKNPNDRRSKPASAPNTSLVQRKASTSEASNAASNAPSNASSNAAASQTTATTNPQLAAVMTYRRKFVDRSKRFELTAYAIGFAGRGVVLLKDDNAEEVVIQMDKLCEEDQIWLRKNNSKILSNGPKVRQYILSTRRF
ncbi:MAG: agmatine deiminase family protein [Mariniblastus sp.]